MAQQPPREPTAKAGGRGLELSQMERFRSLARRLVKVPKSEIDDEYKPTSPDDPGNLVKNPLD
jgi:hypothetical protein